MRILRNAGDIDDDLILSRAKEDAERAEDYKEQDIAGQIARLAITAYMHGAGAAVGLMISDPRAIEAAARDIWSRINEEMNRRARNIKKARGELFAICFYDETE